MSIPLLIDSGAYSAFRRGSPIALDEYVRFLTKVVAKKPDVQYVTLDVIGEGRASFRNWMKLRALGFTPLPVYHVSTDIRWLHRYLKYVDYVALGAIANASFPKRRIALDRIWGDHLVDSNGMPKYKVHAMGVTSFRLIERYPWWSVDSTSWLLTGGYGKIFVPHWREERWCFDSQPYIISVSNQSPALGQRGAHLTTLGPQERRVLRRYLKHIGIDYGRSVIQKGELVVVKKGVCNDYNLRFYVNALFFAKFCQGLPWPRRFVDNRMPGLL